MNLKKILLAAAAASTLLFGQAFAADNTATAVDGNPISNIDDCTLLTAAVTVNLSNGVHGSYYCDTDVASAANGMLFFGTCHESGSSADRSYTCTAADVTASINGCTTAGEAVTLSGRAAFLGSSAGGVISGLNLNANGCTDATVNTRVGDYQSEQAAAL